MKQQLFFSFFSKNKTKQKRKTNKPQHQKTNKTEEDNKQWTTRKKFFVMFNSPSDSSHDISLINIDTLISLKIFIFYSVVIMFDM